jgi:TRAP-type mannitol/chloroaromatic compound transport system permease large subunit
MIWGALPGLLGSFALSGAVLGAAPGVTGFPLLEVAIGSAMRLGAQSLWNTFTGFTLTAIPLFILLGEVLVASGLAKRLHAALSSLFSRAPGELLHTNTRSAPDSARCPVPRCRSPRRSAPSPTRN